MDSIKQNISVFVINIISHNRIFSSIQKLVIFSVLTVILSWLFDAFTITVILTLSILFSFLTCHLLISIDRHYNGVKAVLVFYRTYSNEITSIFKSVKFLTHFLSKFVWGNGEDEHQIIAESADRNDVDDRDAEQNGRDQVISVKETGKSNTGEGWETLLQNEIDCLTRLIVQDFIRPWYCVREQKEEIIEESQMVLHEGLKLFFSNLSKINVQELARDILLCYQEHLSMFQIARMTYRTQPKRRRSPFKRVEPQSKIVNSAAKKIASIEEAFEMKFSYHSAVWGTEYECNYVKSLTHLLVSRLLENHVRGCKTTKLMLVEILSSNVLIPLVELLSNADFLHESMIIILSDETPVEVTDDMDDENDSEDVGNWYEINDVPEKSDVVDSSKDVCNASKTNTNVAEKNQNIETESANLSCNGQQIRTENSLESTKGQLEEQTNIDTPSELDIELRESNIAEARNFDEPEFNVIPASLLTPAQPCGRSCEGMEVVNQKHKDSTIVRSKYEGNTSGEGDVANQTNLKSKSPRKRKGDEFVSGVEVGEEAGSQVNHIQSKETRGGSQASQGSESKVTFALDSSSYEDIEEQKVEDPTELIFQEVNIIDTETTNESRSSTQYTLYVIEYAAWYTTDDNARKLRTQTVKRRFREFVNLQGRLEDNLSYKASLKNTKRPTRWISLPFGNMDRSSIESRKNRLETYLKALIVKPDVSNGQELKEFLGYEGDGHIAFVRKAPENTLPRIDKMLIRSVSGVIDKIGGKMDELTTRASEVLPSFTSRKDQTAWTPSGPYEKDEDNIPLEFGFLKNEIEAESLTSVKTWPIEADLEVLASKLDDEQTDLACTETESLSEEDGMNNQTDSKDVPSGHGNEGDRNSESFVDRNFEENATENKNADSANEKVNRPEEDHGAVLADAALNVGVQALQGRDCWLCRERVVSLTKHLTATAIHHWIETEINELVTEERCLLYIQKVREVIWPGGVFDSSSHRIRSDKQKMTTKIQARKCLAEFLPNFVQGLMDQGDYSAAIDEIIDSLQHEKLNKNFIYTILDLVIERTFPEISTKLIQDQLTQ